jgi:DNA-nicking Smr family endonuclease
MDDTAVSLPIDGVLDLHTFRPAEVKELVSAYLAECRRRGIFSVRIVHGKGIGNLRRTVHTILERLPEVAAFRLAGPEAGGWGATLVELQPLAAGEYHES